tara:strand:- start:86 stop:439 length:354 start_codon:yes stop_codon:yes gene_type:complete
MTDLKIKEKEQPDVQATICKFCNKQFSNIKNKNKHQDSKICIVKKELDKIDFKCQFCNKNFSNIQNKNKHEISNICIINADKKVNDLICKYCEKVYSTKSSKIRHEKTICKRDLDFV